MRVEVSDATWMTRPCDAAGPFGWRKHRLLPVDDVHARFYNFAFVGRRIWRSRCGSPRRDAPGGGGRPFARISPSIYRPLVRGGLGG